MNMQRRKRIEKAGRMLEELLEEITAIQEEEQEAYDNTPESLRESERGIKMWNAIENLDYVMDNLEDVIETLAEAME